MSDRVDELLVFASAGLVAPERAGCRLVCDWLRCLVGDPRVDAGTRWSALEAAEALERFMSLRWESS